MAAKEVKFAVDARDRMLRGMDTLDNAVKVMLGPKGRNASRQSLGAPRITKDGVTVAKEIEPTYKFENMGAQTAREVAWTASDAAGDGTTTATVLSAAIGPRRRQVGRCRHEPDGPQARHRPGVRRLVDDLKGHSRRSRSTRKSPRLAPSRRTATRAIGALIADAMEKVGNEGVITVEEAKSLETELDVVEGMQFDRGYISPYFITNADKMRVDGRPLHPDRREEVGGLQDLLPSARAVVQTGDPLAHRCRGCRGRGARDLFVNKLRGGLKVAAVKAPGFGDRRKAMLQDMAVLTGGQAISEDLGIKLENVMIAMLGRAKKVMIDKDNTTIIDGAGKKKDIEDRIWHIKTQVEEATSDYDKEKLQERLAKLAGGVAVIRVGGATESEVKERKDALTTRCMRPAPRSRKASCRAASGPAGRPRTPCRRSAPNTEDERTGVAILRKARSRPARQIAMNAVEGGSVIVGMIQEKDQYAWASTPRPASTWIWSERNHRPDQGGAHRD